MAGDGATLQLLATLQRWSERYSSQCCYGTGRQRATACSVLTTLLQQRAGPRSNASNAALLRQCVGPCNVAAMAGNATLLQQRVGPCNVAAMAGNATLLQQRVGPRNGAAMADNTLDLAVVLRCLTTTHE
jgi:hypothetical protein